MKQLVSEDKLVKFLCACRQQAKTDNYCLSGYMGVVNELSTFIQDGSEETYVLSLLTACRII